MRPKISHILFIKLFRTSNIQIGFYGGIPKFNKQLNYIHSVQQQKISFSIMNYMSFSNVSQLKVNTQLISNHISKVISEESPSSDEIDSPDMPKRAHSKVEEPTPISPTIRADRKKILNQKMFESNSSINDAFLNVQGSPKNRKYTQDNYAFNLRNVNLRPQIRKSSQNEVIEELVQHEKDGEEIGHSQRQEYKQLQRNQTQLQLRQRKGSCNIDIPSFLKKAIRKNSDQPGFLPTKSKEIMIKKKGLGWSENSNFRLADKTNSEHYSSEANNSPTLFSPKSKNLRKHSDFVQTPRKAVPSFLAGQKIHRQSLNFVECTEEHKTSINDFKIIKELGKGAFGRVVLAIQKATRMFCAIKIMSKRQIKENSMLEQLIRQLKIQLFLNHPNIVKVYHFFDDLLHCYIVEQCALDGHLSEFIKKTPNPIPEPDAANYMKQICEAVSALHTNSIIHRDLKPQNVLLHEGVIKVCDFGWSVYRDANLRTTFCGTPVYLCPQILMGDQYDESVDIWTLGITLYEMFYKSNPFKVTTKDELINIINNPIDYPGKYKISQGPKSFIEMCLSKRAVDRPNIRELLLHEFIINIQTVKDQKW